MSDARDIEEIISYLNESPPSHEMMEAVDYIFDAFSSGKISSGRLTFGDLRRSEIVKQDDSSEPEDYFSP